MFGNKKDDKKKDDNLKDLEQEIENLENQESSEEAKKDDSFEEKFNALNDKYLRFVAEFENFKRRSTEEKIQNFNLGGKQVLGTILPFLDNFKRAVDSCEEELKNNEWVKGVFSVEQNLVSDLEKIGFQKIKTDGEKFNYEKHEALMQDPNTEKDLISSVLEEGYEYNGQVIRHAKVSVGSK